MSSDLMTISETMEYFKVTRECIRRWSNKGILTKTKVGGKPYFKRSEVENLAK